MRHALIILLMLWAAIPFAVAQGGQPHQADCFSGIGAGVRTPCRPCAASEHGLEMDAVQGPGIWRLTAHSPSAD